METFTQSTSSIDANWPPTVDTQQRLRGFYVDNVITDQQSAQACIDQVEATINAMHAKPGVNRASIRVLAEIGALANLQTGRANIEAILPVRQTSLGLVYLGLNEEARALDTAHLSNYHKLLRTVRTLSPKQRDSLATPELLTPAQAHEFCDQFTVLYAPFDYDQSKTTDILTDSANTIAFARMDGVVASTAMAEQATIAINNFGNLHIAESTEASTLSNLRGNGLYASVSGFLIQHLVEQQRTGEANIDILYGESNLAMPGVIRAAAQNGRNFCYFDRYVEFEQTPTFGILPQNFSVNDGVETRQFNDFAVSYVPL